MLDTDAEPNRLGCYTCLPLLLHRHLPMRSGRRMTRQGLRIAEIDQSLDQFQRIVEFSPALEATTNSEGEQRACPAAKILRRERVIGIFRKTDVVHPGYSRVIAQEIRYPLRVFDMAVDPESDGFNSLQQQKGAQRRQD